MGLFNSRNAQVAMAIQNLQSANGVMTGYFCVDWTSFELWSILNFKNHSVFGTQTMGVKLQALKDYTGCFLERTLVLNNGDFGIVTFGRK